MSWLSHTAKFSEGEINVFKFSEDVQSQSGSIADSAQRPEVELTSQPILIHTIIADGSDIQEASFSSELKFQEWIEDTQSSFSLQDKPKMVIIMHERRQGGANYLPYRKDIFRTTSEKMYQHRSLAWSISRVSPAIFNHYDAAWTVDGSEHGAIVYNCRSDVVAPLSDDDIMISTTYFVDKPCTFSCIYGCPPDFSDDLTRSLHRMIKKPGFHPETAFHPLLMPMIFAEHERGRFMEVSEFYGPQLKQQTYSMETELMKDRERKKQALLGGEEKNRESLEEDGNSTPETRHGHASVEDATEYDCRSTRLLTTVTDLKLGLESFRTMLGALEAQFEIMRDMKLGPRGILENDTIGRSRCSERMKKKLKEMTAEVDYKLRTFEGLMTGLARASEVEWNYYSRRDAEDSFVITRASHQDSTQMKLISLVGMIFLPGTFLATFFSMTFFKWIPDEDDRVVSPYLGIYAGLTLVFTLATAGYWILQQRIAKAKDLKQLQRQSRGEFGQV